MKILREGLGFSEEFDLADESQYASFCEGVVQDYEVADELIDEIRRDGYAEVNRDDPEFYERYRLVADAPTWGETHPEEA